MATLNEYFRSEARDFLLSLERSLQRAPGPDASELHRAVRGLRGTAQMAREQRVFDVISAFESVTRSIADGALAWSDNIAARARDTIADLRVLLDATEDDESLDARVSGAAARWRETDPDPAPAAAVVDAGTREFREFAAREAANIADALDHGIQDLQADPMNREPLTTILRRQRALLGSARLDEIPVIADILRAVEDLTRVIVKLDVGVKQEWLDIYRVARDALQTTIAPLLRDELPQSSNSVSRLRHMRAELLERYGNVHESTKPPADPFAPGSASAPAAPFMPPAGSVTPEQAAPPAAPARFGMPSAASGPAMSSRTPPASPSSGAPAVGRGSAAPFMPPASTHSPRVPPAWSSATVKEPGSQSAEGSAPPVADTHAADVHAAGTASPEDGVLDLRDEDAADGPYLELGEEAAEAPLLELDEEASVDESPAGGSMLELSEDVEAGGAAPGLDPETEADAPVLELDDEAVEAPMLELDEEAPADDSMLQLEESDAYGDTAELLELNESDAVMPGSSGGSDSDPSASADPAGPSASLARALELRDVIDRVAAYDPAARAAVDELYALIRQALG